MEGTSAGGLFERDTIQRLLSQSMSWMPRLLSWIIVACLFYLKYLNWLSIDFDFGVLHLWALVVVVLKLYAIAYFLLKPVLSFTHPRN